MENKQYLTPIAIIVAGLIVGGALYFRPGSVTTPQGENTVAAIANAKTAADKLAQINPNEHIRGNLKAPVKIVEFSDLECPFCKAFHMAMQKLTAKYGDKVLWVYRHFPLDKGPNPLHPKAGPEAVATECVFNQGGNPAFWNYVDKIFAITPSNNGLDLSLLPKLAGEVGVNIDTFNKCIASADTKSAIESDYKDGVAVEVDGTPYTIMLDKDNQKFLVFREEFPTTWDAETKAIMTDLYQFEQDSLKELQEAAANTPTGV